MGHSQLISNKDYSTHGGMGPSYSNNGTHSANTSALGGGPYSKASGRNIGGSMSPEKRGKIFPS